MGMTVKGTCIAGLLLWAAGLCRAHEAALAEPPGLSGPIESIAAAAPSQQASWRTRYELGAGDVINVSFYGRSPLDRPGLRIAPDGTLSYLQLNSVPVAGLTIDEVRDILEERLSEYYRNVRLIVTPQELVSKRYVILGEVMDKGVFALNRPMTILEALARSRGVNTALFEQSTIESADMQRSFVIRNNERLAVDLEALYHEGDLSQNIQLEPGDYIFIASGLTNEFYVFGAVNQPGVQGMNVQMSVVAALSRREGFNEVAWKRKVLLVRGRLSEPETLIVDVNAVLHGEEPDVLIEPGDIIYVSARPWAKIEDIIDSALMAFVQSATSTWVNQNVPDLNDNPILPNTGWRTAP